MNPTNALTIDVEDYFQVHALSKSIQYENWDQYPSRVEKNTYKILNLLDSQQSTLTNSQPATNNQIRATFFILGWVVKRYPGLVKEIHRRGHEIASHGYRHQVIYDQTHREFQEDIKKSKQILEDLTGEEVIGYRAPTYSITKKTMWALNILAKEGYKYDSSIFPIRHDYYGMPFAPRFPFIWNLNGTQPTIEPLDFKSELFKSSLYSTNNGQQTTNKLSRGKLYEFPISTVSLFGRNLPCSGGGYFRLFPYPITRAALNRINGEGKPFIFYLHPWEIDPDISRANNLSPLARFRTYVNLNKTESRFKKLISQFRFSSIKSLFSGLLQ